VLLTGAPVVWGVDVRARRVAALAPRVLTPAELARAARLRQPGDREAYLAAHVALRQLLGRYLGLPPRELAIDREPCPGCGGPHGRPRVPGSPVQFSLSRTEGLAVLAFAPGPVGVDVEPVPRSPARVARVASRLHDREQAELLALPAGRRPAAFARVWVRKEAYLKALGTGLGRSPARDYLGTRPEPAAPPGWRVADVTVPAGYRAAVSWSPRTGV
jgi:4'-phosphopantetheinyl transferase